MPSASGIFGPLPLARPAAGQQSGQTHLNSVQRYRFQSLIRFANSRTNLSQVSHCRSYFPAGPQALFFVGLRLTFLRPTYRGMRAGVVSFRLLRLAMDWAVPFRSDCGPGGLVSAAMITDKIATLRPGGFIASCVEGTPEFYALHFRGKSRKLRGSTDDATPPPQHGVDP